MKVLDVGCGVGGPAREICKFSGAHITGLNNNDYQIARANRYAKKEKLDDKLSFVKGDFMQMQFESNSFDAVYAIEATVHAPSLQGIYSEIFRVLKPGGKFGVYEWLMTDKYDPLNAQHCKIRLGIELGNGISNMEPIQTALNAIQKAGFILETCEDLAVSRQDAIPWWWPLSGEFKYIASVFDLFTIMRMTKLGRQIIHFFLGLLEMIGLVPPGTKKTADSLATGADSLVEGAKLNLFTPMYLIVAKKPDL